MTWVLGFAYVRRADRVFDPLSEKAVDVALEGTQRRGARLRP